MLDWIVSLAAAAAIVGLVLLLVSQLMPILMSF